ncbi:MULTISPECIES: CPBP family intramembrane glutamic endopeptidase [unclassified Kribbella]|uniref:CPBP family intramembrane glutamic endopeptidase n=1 Tax=unclassified Kribbella TaxID=2644121 RepID=UPI00301935AD
MATTIKRLPETLPPEAPESPRRRIVPFIRRHAVATYYALTFAISFGGFLLVLGPDGFFATGSAIAGGGAVALMGPAVAGVLLTGLVDGRRGLRRLVSRLRRWRVGARWYAVALLTGPLVMGASVFALSLASPDFRPDIVTADNRLSIVAVGIALGLVGPFLEELGWTGYALPRLRERYGVLTTGLVMGLLWGAWHFPLFAGERDPEGSVPAALLVGVLLLAWLPPYRVLMVWVYDRTQSLLVAYLMHVPISTTTIILASDATPGDATVTKALVWGAAFWAILGVVAWANKGHLTRRQHGVPHEALPG